MSHHCPLCKTHAATANVFHIDKRREYYRCETCYLVFVPERFHLSHSEEKNIYDLHQNSPQDAGYRRFLSRLFQPLQQRLDTSAQGLDFGCGPGPTLSVMFEEQGYRVNHYDPHYANDPNMLERRYDFITCTEVIEHFRDPASSWSLLNNLLGPHAWLGIMTKLVINQEAFSRWHYIQDPTHICFYSKQTLNWIAAQYNYQIEFIAADVVLFQRKDNTSL